MVSMLITIDLDRKAIKSDGLSKSDIAPLMQKFATAMKWAGFKPWKYKDSFFSTSSYKSKEEAMTSVMQSIEKYAKDIPRYARSIDINTIDSESDLLRSLEGHTSPHVDEIENTIPKASTTAAPTTILEDNDDEFFASLEAKKNS